MLFAGIAILEIACMKYIEGRDAIGFGNGCLYPAIPVIAVENSHEGAAGILGRFFEMRGQCVRSVHLKCMSDETEQEKVTRFLRHTACRGLVQETLTPLLVADNEEDRQEALGFVIEVLIED